MTMVVLDGGTEPITMQARISSRDVPMKMILGCFDGGKNDCRRSCFGLDNVRSNTNRNLAPPGHIYAAFLIHYLCGKLG